MSDYGPRERQCTYKRGYSSRSEAKAIARKTERYAGKAATKMKVYHCPFCNEWHVGHAKEDPSGVYS